MADQSKALVLAGGRDLATLADRLTSEDRFSEADFALMSDGVRKGTREKLRVAWKNVLKFTGERGFTEVPMTVPACVKMIDWCWQQPGRYGRPMSPANIRLMLWALTRAHKVAMRPDGERGWISPVDSVEVKTAFKGYVHRYKSAGHRPDIASPITADEAVAMIQTCDVRSPLGLRDALAIALLYDGGWRAGELVVADADRPGMLWRDVEIRVANMPVVVDWTRPQDIELQPEDALLIFVPESKTSGQVDGGDDEVLLPAHPPRYAFNCPVRLLLAWQALCVERGIEQQGQVLKQVMHGMRAPADGRPKRATVTSEDWAYKGLALRFARWVADAQIGVTQGRQRHLVLHGMRAGAAEEAANRGADTPELNRHFRWSQFGTTAQRYAARGRRRKQNPAKRIWADPDEAAA